MTDFRAFSKVHSDLVARVGELKQINIEQVETQALHGGWYSNAETRMIFERGDLRFLFVLKNEDKTWKVVSYQEQ